MNDGMRMRRNGGVFDEVVTVPRWTVVTVQR